MKNRFEIRGEITAIFLQRRDGTVLETIIDTADLPKAMEIDGTWRALRSTDGRSFYCHYTRYWSGKTQSFYLHRVITDAPKGMDVDHRNHNKLDNRRTNLRVLTHAQNQQNRNGAQRTNTSGIRGVKYEPDRDKWRARITLGGREHFVGRFDSAADAEAAVVAYRREHMPYSATDQVQGRCSNATLHSS